jgi:hypothetical protein
MIRGDWSFRNVARWERQVCRVRRESPTRQASGGERARRPIRKTFVFPPGPSELDDEVLALDVAEIAKPSPKRFHLTRIARRRGGAEEGDPLHLPRLRLRLCGERRKNEAENDREPDQPHGHLGWERLAGV